jgi:hypothetical protein
MLSRVRVNSCAAPSNSISPRSDDCFNDFSALAFEAFSRTALAFILAENVSGNLSSSLTQSKLVLSHNDNDSDIREGIGFE